MSLAKRLREWWARRRAVPAAPTIIDWGSDMTACLEYIEAHPLPDLPPPPAGADPKWYLHGTRERGALAPFWRPSDGARFRRRVGRR